MKVILSRPRWETWHLALLHRKLTLSRQSWVNRFKYFVDMWLNKAVLVSVKLNLWIYVNLNRISLWCCQHRVTRGNCHSALNYINTQVHCVRILDNCWSIYLLLYTIGPPGISSRHSYVGNKWEKRVSEYSLWKNY